MAEGYVWGRGTLDTKGLGVMHLLALERLVREGAIFRRPVVLLDRTIGDARIKVETVKTSTPTAISPIEGPFFDAVRQALARHVPGAIVFPLQVAGATDSRFLRARNVPAYGFGPFVLEAHEIDRVHGVDERISENLLLGVRIACDVIRELCVA